MKKKRKERKDREEISYKENFFFLYPNVIMLQPPGPSLSFKSNFPESLKLYGPNDPAEVLLYRKTRRGWNETLSQGYNTAGPSNRQAALMLGINLKHCTVFTIRWSMILIMAGATLELSVPRRAVSTCGESQKVTRVMNVSQQWLLFSICRNPGRVRTTIKTMKKEKAIEKKWEQFSTKVSLILISIIILCIFCLLYSQKYNVCGQLCLRISVYSLLESTLSFFNISTPQCYYVRPIKKWSFQALTPTSQPTPLGLEYWCKPGLITQH